MANSTSYSSPSSASNIIINNNKMDIDSSSTLADISIGGHRKRTNQRKRNTETIHSGHFMVSEIGDDQSDQDQKQPTTAMVPAASRNYSSGVSIDQSLLKLFQCMSLAYNDCKLTSPKWKTFKGLKMNLKDKIRLNNIIWRTWHMQYISGRKPVVCQFHSTLDTERHKQTEAILLEGKYWKRRMTVVQAEYNKWRRYYQHLIIAMGKRKSKKSKANWNYDWNNHSLPRWSNNLSFDSLFSSASSDGIPSTGHDYGYPHHHHHHHHNYQNHQESSLSMLMENQVSPYHGNYFDYPNSREISSCGMGAEFMQPGLEQLQPNIDFMDTFEPIQDFISFRPQLPTLPEDPAEFNSSGSMIKDTFSGQTGMISKTGQANFSGYVDQLSAPTETHGEILPQPQSLCENANIIEFVEPHHHQATNNSNLFGKMDYGSETTFGPMFPESTGGSGSTQIQIINNQNNNGQSFPVPAIYYGPSENVEKNQRGAMKNVIQQPSSSSTTSATMIPQPNDHQQRQSFPDTRYATGTMRGQMERSLSLPVSFSAGTTTNKMFQQHGSLKPSYNESQQNFTSKPNPIQFVVHPTSNQSAINKSYEHGINHLGLTSKNQFGSNLSPASSMGSLELNSGTVTSGLSSTAFDLSSLSSSQQHRSKHHHKYSNSNSSNKKGYQLNLKKLKPTPIINPSGGPSMFDYSGADSLKDKNIFGPEMPPSAVSPPSSSRSSLNSPPYMMMGPMTSAYKVEDSHRIQYKERRRVCHINAEQKRRCNIKNGFDTLRSLLPSLSSSHNSKISKAAMLNKAADYINTLKEETYEQQKEYELLKQQMENFNKTISMFQNQLPTTGAPIAVQRTNRIKEQYTEYVRQKTLQNWKFWIFSIIMQSLLDSYCGTVSTTNMEEMCKSLMRWLDQSCCLVALRKDVLNSLRRVSTTTNILSNPETLQDEILKIIMNENEKNDE